MTQILPQEFNRDKELKLSINKGKKLHNEDDDLIRIEEIIKKSLRLVDLKNKQEKLRVLKGSVSYPSDYVFVSLTNRVYTEKNNVQRKNLHGENLDQTLGNWQLLTVAENKNISNGYVGAAYWNPDMQQVIIAHRGTEPDDPKTMYGALLNDINGIYFNQHSSQIDSAITFTDKIISVLKKINRQIEKKSYIQLFFTGHSLGGWLAQITTFTAKYLISGGDKFVQNRDFEKTGYHAGAVVFDSPGGRKMLERIQDRLVSRCSHSLINCLDVVSYLSAPNFINACNAPVGEVYRIFMILSEEDKLQMKKDTAGYTRVMHKNQKFKEVFDPKTGRVYEDEIGNVRIKKVQDWPSLISGDKAGIVRWAINKSVKWLGFKRKRWYDTFDQELDKFFTLADEFNDYHLEDEDINIEINGYRSIRYKTKKLDKNYKNKRSLNVFTESERQFLEEYKRLQEHGSSLPSTFKLEELFSDFDEELKGKTIELLEKCKIEGGNISAANLPEFIPYIKHMLHFFPEIKDKTKEACQNFSADILGGIYQSASSLYLESFNRSLSFTKDTDLENFLTTDNLKVLHTVQSNTSLGIVKAYKIFNAIDIDNDYYNKKNHVFLNLDRIFHLREETFINFLEKIDYQYLLVLECNGALSSKIEGFFTKLYNVLQNNHNIKVILVTEKGSDLSKFISECVVNNPADCREKNNEVKWNDLTSESQSKFLEKTVIFQGREVPLSAVVNTADEEVLNTIIDPETIVELFENEEIEIGKALPNLGEAEDYYVDRKLAKNVKVKEEILQDNTLTDLFAISGISEEKPGSSRFTTLGENAAEDFNNLCNQYPNDNIHWLKRESNGDLIWQKSHGKTLSGLRRYMEIYEPEDKYSTAIKIVDVKDVSKFDERIVVVAAEPGMGKTTALTRLGIKETDNSKWLIRINLIEYKDQLEQRNFAEEGSVIKFLSENNIASNALTERLLALRLNNSGNVVFLLDGFDEITSQGQTNVINLLKKLQETKVEKVLISTRLHLRNELENSLSTVAYTLKPFSREDQVKFLQKFWQRDLDPSIDSECLDNYINKLLEFVSESIGDKERKFMGIPMQMRMVAEAFQGATQDQELLDHPEYTFPKDFDMLKLYGRFLHVKYLVYFGKRRAENIDLDEDEDWLTIKPTKVHRSLAFKVLFPEMEMGEKLPSEKDKHRVNRVGIAQCIDDRIVFIHRTFAEYFAAGFLADRLDEDKDSKKSKTTIEFLAQELFESENEIVKTFLDYYLAKNRVHAAILKGKLDLNDVISLEENVDVTDNLGRTALHYAPQEGYEDIIRIC